MARARNLKPAHHLHVAPSEGVPLGRCKTPDFAPTDLRNSLDVSLRALRQARKIQAINVNFRRTCSVTDYFAFDSNSERCRELRSLTYAGDRFAKLVAVQDVKEGTLKCRVGCILSD